MSDRRSIRAECTPFIFIREGRPERRSSQREETSERPPRLQRLRDDVVGSTLTHNTDAHTTTAAQSALTLQLTLVRAYHLTVTHGSNTMPDGALHFSGSFSPPLELHRKSTPAPR